jgi:4-carboxymuconolactone decarboxylase
VGVNGGAGTLASALAHPYGPGMSSDPLTLREEEREDTGLDARTQGLVKIAALIALGAPPASYMWQVEKALDGGATPEDVLGVLKAVAPQVGSPRVVAAAPELMAALGQGALTPEAMAQLRSLAQLHDQGILTDQEFNEQKAKVLRG